MKNGAFNMGSSHFKIIKEDEVSLCRGESRTSAICGVGREYAKMYNESDDNAENVCNAIQARDMCCNGNGYATTLLDIILVDTINYNGDVILLDAKNSSNDSSENEGMQ